jgi:tRNA threonylcarbamoyladenosine biosynthesis protein TsaB
MFLAIDTSTRYAGLALANEKNTIASLTWHSQGSHTTELMPAIQWLLKSMKMQANDITGIGVALGPGAFSALRAGISVAKGMAIALRLPIVGVGTLEMEAFAYSGIRIPICPVLEVGKNIIAWAMFHWYRGKWYQYSHEQTGSLTELATYINRQTLFCGEGAAGLASGLREILTNRVVIPGTYTPGLRLQSLVHLGMLRIDTYDENQIASLQPLYLRQPVITESKKWTTKKE